MTFESPQAFEQDLLVVVDWGSSNLRGYLVDTTGAVHKSIQRELGAKKLLRQEFPATFSELILELSEGRAISAAILAGMVGSDLGWHSVPMQKAPLSAKKLGNVLFDVPDPGTSKSFKAFIVPGVFCEGEFGHAEMMRGEEVQIFGALSNCKETSGLFCLPGTHTKWVSVLDGSIQNINTSMTGEVFQLLCEQSVLSSFLVVDQEALDLKAFDMGVRAAESGLDSLQAAFTTRARVLVSGMQKGHVARSYLSGILVGSEVRNMLEFYQRHPRNSPDSGFKAVTIVGGEQISVLYQRVCSQMGLSAQIIDGATAVIAGAIYLFNLPG